MTDPAWRATCPVCARELKVSPFDPLRPGPGWDIERCPEHPTEAPVLAGGPNGLAFAADFAAQGDVALADALADVDRVRDLSPYDRGRQDALGFVMGICVGYMRWVGLTLSEIQAQIDAAWVAADVSPDLRVVLEAMVDGLAQVVGGKKKRT